MLEIRNEIIRYESIDGSIFDSKDECKKHDANVYAKRIHLRRIDVYPLMYSMVAECVVFAAHFDSAYDAKLFENPDFGGHAMGLNYMDCVLWNRADGKISDKIPIVGDVVIVTNDGYVSVYDAREYVGDSLKIANKIVNNNEEEK